MEDQKQPVDLERRIRHLEREFAQVQVMLGMQSTTITEIRDTVTGLRNDMQPKPVNIPSWIGAVIGVLSLMGMLLYTAFIAPVEGRLDLLERDVADIRGAPDP